MKIEYYEIVIKQYHNDIVARIRYSLGDYVHESALYSVPEINNILALWRMGELCGSFGIGDTLSPNATFQMVQS